MTAPRCNYMVMCDRAAVALVDMSPVNPELPICQRCLDLATQWQTSAPAIVKTPEETS